MKIKFLIVFYFFTSHCFSQRIDSTNIQGYLKDKTYVNDFFEFSFPIPETWSIQNKDQLESVKNVHKEIATENKKELANIVNDSEKNSYYLLTVFKYELKDSGAFNPSIIIIAENLSSLPDIKNSDDYLNHVKQLLSESKVNYLFGQGRRVMRIKNDTFKVMKGKCSIYNKYIFQEYITTIKNNYALSYLLTYTSKKDRRDLYYAIKNVR